MVADSLYGEHSGFRKGLHELNCGYVLALKPAHAWWHSADELGSLVDIARASWGQRAEERGNWIAVERHFRDGHMQTWWALEVEAGPYGTEKANRAFVVTTDPATLPEQSTWYLISNLPTPGSERAKTSEIACATVSEVARLYGLRMWVEQSYKQVKTTLGWAEYQVRSDKAIRRHWALVCCAFTFCWWQMGQHQAAESCGQEDLPGNQATSRALEKKLQHSTERIVAKSATPLSGLAGAVDDAVAILAGLVITSSTACLTRTA